MKDLWFSALVLVFGFLWLSLALYPRYSDL